jgi:hypothetical protein
MERGVMAVAIIEMVSLGKPFWMSIGVAEASIGEKPALEKKRRVTRESR